jgi:hypothetical protein
MPISRTETAAVDTSITHTGMFVLDLSILAVGLIWRSDAL